MADSLTINIADLRAALARGLDALETRLGSVVRVDADYYWHLPVENAFNMAEQPTALTVGQLSDDLKNVQAQHERLPEEAWHDLSHLIGVLRLLELVARF